MKKAWDAKKLGKELKVNFKKIPLSEFEKGLNVELEHGKLHKKTDVTHNDHLMTAKIALAHLNEMPDYYSKLAKMEKKK